MGSKRKKFIQYKVEVYNLEGTKQTVSTKNTKTNDYKAMLEVYRETKKASVGKDCVIKFKGITKKGEVGCLFTKENKSEETLNAIRNAKLANNTTVGEILNIVKNAEESFKMRKKLLEDQGLLCNKRIDTILHNLECDTYDTEESKLEVVDELIKIRKQRRDIKDECSAIDYMKQTKLINFVEKTKIDNALNWIDKNKVKRVNKQKVIRETGYKYAPRIYVYNTELEKNNLVKQLEKRYDRVMLDSNNKEITCYTNVYSKEKRKYSPNF